MKKRSAANILKNISYIILPIFIVLGIISGTKTIYNMEYQEDKQEIDYFETRQFANNYMDSIEYAIYRIKDKDYISDSYYQMQEKTEEEKGKLYNYSSHIRQNFRYLIVDRKTGNAYTNIALTMETDTIEKIKEILNQKKKYWNIENGNINTNIEKLSLSQIKYNDSYNEVNLDYDIYTALEDDLKYQDKYSTKKAFFDMMNILKNEQTYIFLPISAIMVLILLAIIIVGIGIRDENGNIILNWFDKLPLLIAGIIIVVLMIIGSLFAIMLSTDDWTLALTGVSCVVTSYYILFIISIETIIKRIKSGTFFKNTISYRIIKIIKKTTKNVFENINTTGKVILVLLTILVLNIILINIGEFGVILDIALWIYIIYRIISEINCFTKIKEQTKRIYEGNINERLKEEEFRGKQKELAIYVNNIAGGLSNAIEKSLKSERLKTELITNVSHDIKTPLTSIINYVDLMKKEKIENEKVKEYLEILDNKSQRLKKLTEDLVEASKASSGNIKLNMEKLAVNELIKQVYGEFEDKFSERNLEIMIDLPEETKYIMADSRYLYRVLENIYGNISKYALENSRVYIDVIENENKINIEIKNISKEKLNISADELMQRFVRGDSSRNTSGSGLGLSIAESLTKLQGGEFKLHLDGDLFKVIIKFNKAN